MVQPTFIDQLNVSIINDYNEGLPFKSDFRVGPRNKRKQLDVLSDGTNGVWLWGLFMACH